MLPTAVKPAVGFPTADTGPASVVITKTDWAQIVSFTEQLKAWIEAASACLHAREQ